MSPVTTNMFKFLKYLFQTKNYHYGKVSLFKFIFLTRIIFDKLFTNNQTKSWIGLTRINNTWTWSDGETWNHDNPQLGNIGTFFGTLQGWTCGNCTIEAATLNNPFLVKEFELCEKKVD